jgi:UDP-N-acetylmuramoylalanine--D-glutamate ligase
MISPGIPPSHPSIRTLGSEKILSEYDLYRLAGTFPTIGVTGTNGKSTVVTWIAHILKGAGKRVVAGGNLGIPMLDLVEKEGEIAVLELSSFQLYYTRRGKVEIAILTNLATNHLDWHRSFEEYRDAKAKLFTFLPQEGWGILPRHLLSEIMPPSGRIVSFAEGDGEISLLEKGVELRPYGLFFPYPPSLIFPHDRENFAVSATASLCAGADPYRILEASQDLPRLPHRLEYLGEWAGRRFVNDSKSTTPHAMKSAVISLKPPLLLLAGGKEKGLDFRPYAREVASRIKKLYAYGECREALFSAFRDLTEVERFSDLASAFLSAVSESERDDTILLSPGTSSFDEFHSFEERGERFRILFQEWQKKNGAIKEGTRGK